MGKANKGASKERAQVQKDLWAAIKTQNAKTINWCLSRGGHRIVAQAEDGNTVLHLAVWLNATKSLERVLSFVDRHSKDIDCLDEQGRTALMVAAAKGHTQCCRMLWEARANLKLKSEDEGMTARDYAVKYKKTDVVAFLDNPTAAEEESSEEEEGEEEEQLSRAERKAKFAQPFGKAKKKEAEPEAEEEDEAATSEAALALGKGGAAGQVDLAEKLAAVADEAVWPEITRVLEEALREVKIVDAEPAGNGNVIDPSLWRCVTLNLLELKVADGALTELPEGRIASLVNLTTLIVSGNALTHLPADLATAKTLKNLFVADNKLTTLPAELGELTTGLEVLDISGNEFTSLASVAPLTGLVTLRLDRMQGITSLDELNFEELGRLNTLSATGNAIGELPAGVGHLKQLITLDVKGNKLKDLPVELGDLEKKLKTLQLDDNPLDSKIKKVVAQGDKKLFKHLQKQGKGKKGKGKGKKKGKKKKAESSDEEDESD